MTGHFLSLVVGAFVGGAAAYLGSLMITKRMALVGDALGHVALPGMGFALLLNLDVSLGAFAFLAVGILLIWNLGEKTILSLETLVGVVFVSSLAVGFLIIPEPELLKSLIGDISNVTPFGVILAVVVSTLIVFLVRRIYPGMMLLNISQDLAVVEGVKLKRYNLIYLSAVALIVSVGVKVTGSLLVGALVILPPATARILSDSLGRYTQLSVAIGVISNIVGILFARITQLEAGPLIILVNSLFFTFAFLKKHAKNYFRKGRIRIRS